MKGILWVRSTLFTSLYFPFLVNPNPFMKVGEGGDKQVAKLKTKMKNKNKNTVVQCLHQVLKSISPPPSFIITSFNMKANIFVTGAGAREMSTRFSKCFLVAITC